MALQFPNPSGKTWRKDAPLSRALSKPEPEPLELAMTDPFERAEEEVVYVEVERTLRRRVPDYEAEVLIRNGWKEVT